MKKLLFRIAGILAALAAPLLISSVAHAATATWDSEGTPVVDTAKKTITYDISDPLNWVGDIAPVDGDSLVFPANLAQVDPTSAFTTDYQWAYIVNNTLGSIVSPVAINGINFSGDTGASCSNDTANDRNDSYSFKGNPIILTSNITDSRTGSCVSQGYITFATNITVNSNIQIDARLNKQYGSELLSSTDPILTYGSNILTLNNSITGSREEGQRVSLIGTGKVIFSSGGSFIEGAAMSLSEYRDFEVSAQSRFTIMGVDLAHVRNLTMKDKATVDIWGDSDVDILTNLIFEGNAADNLSPADSDYENTYEGITSKYQYSKFHNQKENRLEISNRSSEKVDDTHYRTVMKKTQLKGDLSFTDDLILSLYSDLNVIGKIQASGKQFIVNQPAIGKLYVNGSENNSANQNGFVSTPSYYTVELSGEYTGSNELIVSASEKKLLKDGSKFNVRTNVSARGILGGIGTVGVLYVYPEGILAPGMSPGCINSGNLTLNGIYQVELAGTTACTDYDQTKVTGNVTLTGSTLQLSRLNGFNPALNSSFVIIDNDGTDTVTGTFTGLLQGATIVLEGTTYTVSYTGGDGNDVTLVASAVATSPAATAPNTGFEVLKSGFVLPILAMVSALGIIGIQRFSYKKNK